MSGTVETTHVAFTIPPKFAGAVQSHQEDLLARGLSPNTLGTYEDRLRAFGRYLASRGYDLPDVTPFVVRQYLNHLRQRGDARATKNARAISPHTVEDHWSALRAFNNFLRRAKLSHTNFMDGISKPKVPPLPPIFVPEDVLRRALDVFDPRRPPAGYPPGKWRFVALRNRAVLVTLLDTMIRSSELRGLRVEDVDFTGGFVLVTGKGGKIRRPPFSLQCVKVLKAYMRERSERFRLPYDRGPLFLDVTGKPLTKSGLRSVFRATKNLCGFEGRFFPHAIRHTGAKWALKAGADVFSLAKVLGHSTLAVTRRYAELDEDEIARQHRVWSPANRLLGQ
jgi:integrase/recombinase XerD